MRSGIDKTIREFKNILLVRGMDIRMEGERLKADYYYYNLFYTITSASIISLLSLIGLIGTFAPFASGFILPTINATAVYLTAFFVNIFFLGLLMHELNRFDGTPKKRTGLIIQAFMAADMIVACLLFFTTQNNSSLFFEYILVTTIIYLIPNVRIPAFIRNVVLNAIGVFIVFTIIGRALAWQDIVDLLIMYIVCFLVNYMRLLSFLRREKDKFEREDENEKLYRDSRHDQLTGLYNRTALDQDLPSFYDHPLCIALVDLDLFKNFNDLHGHVYGDSVLQEVGQDLNETFHGEDEKCYRYGGDEFLVIVNGKDRETFATKLFALAETISGHEDFGMTLSIGYYGGIPSSKVSFRKLIDQADHYLYEAKAKGKGQIEGDLSALEIDEEIEQSSPTTLDEGLDPLTGLPTMRTFFKKINEVRKQPRDVDQDGELAVLYFDIINFKLINLRYGITSADQFLISMARCLRRCFPQGIIAHLDGDHFAVLTDNHDLDKRVSEARKRVEEVFPDSVECCIGVCVWDDHELPGEKISNYARVACDEARKNVKTFTAYYSKEASKKIEMSAYVVSHLDEAIHKNWITVYYQPVVRALTNQVCGAEALARWNDPERGLLQPGAFIPALEDARTIWRLDLCLIRQVVEQIAERYRQGLPEIPISINLSRIDFISCDIFKEIEALVVKYDIPRRMLHIEVTESIMTSSEDTIINTLDAFRQTGYELWMDDFGSGYSTLNLLKDYSFDVLKLDMIFLRHDTKRSRSIIASVVNMDKRIGIRTLAEGVETKEQAEFLRAAGCEKLQGYYFGKPMPFDEMVKNCMEKGLGVESTKQKVCYDRLSHVNFLVDVPMAVVEMRDQTAHILFANNPLQMLLESDGFVDLHEVEKNINDSNNVASRELLKAGRFTNESRNSGEIMTSFKGHGRRLQYRYLGKYNTTSLFVIKVFDHSSKNVELTAKAQMLLNLTYFYRYIYSLDPETMMITPVRFTNSAMGTLNASTLIDEKGQISDVLPEIYMADEKRYRAFIDPKTLKRRLERAKYHSIAGTFRTQDHEGRFIKMTHRMLLTPNSDGRKILYVMRKKDDDQNGSNSVLGLPNETLLDANIKQYFEDLIVHSPIPFFWKDAHRRYLGASQTFLDFYGLTLDELIGKTDEEMGWYPNDEENVSVEDKILKTGKMFKLIPMKCIAQGVTHDLFTTKWPTYKNGQISGLMGYFLNAKYVDRENTTENNLQMIPEYKGVSHFIDDLIAYKTNYEMNKKNFGVIYIKVPELPRIANNFDRETMQAAVYECFKTITAVAGHKASTAYADIGQFMVASAYHSPQELVDLADAISKRIDTIHEVNGMPTTLRAQIHILYTAEVIKSLDDMKQGILNGNQKSFESQNIALDYDTVIETIMDAMPIGCYILKPDHIIQYWNKEAEKLTGFTASEMQGRKCTEMPLGCAFVNGEFIPDHKCPAVVAFTTKRECSLSMFMKTKDGKERLVKNTIVPIKDEGGQVIELISLFVPIFGEDYDTDLNELVYEAVTRDSLTSLPSRKYMEFCLDKELELYHRTGRPFALLSVSFALDQINSNYGEDNSDQILRNMGLALRKYGRRTDRFCRWSKNEFVGLLRLRNVEDIKKATDRFDKLISDSNEIDCQAVLGVTAVREDDTIETMISRLDHYLYEAKKSSTQKIVTDYTEL